MAKSNHPARRARNLTGAVSALALVGMMTSFQLAAAANENTQASPGTPAPTATEVAPTAAPVEQAPTDVAPVAADPAPAAPAPVAADPAPAAPAPAPAPVVAPPAPAPAPPSGTTGGSTPAP